MRLLWPGNPQDALALAAANDFIGLLRTYSLLDNTAIAHLEKDNKLLNEIISRVVPHLVEVKKMMSLEQARNGEPITVEVKGINYRIYAIPRGHKLSENMKNELAGYGQVIVQDGLGLELQGALNKQELDKLRSAVRWRMSRRRCAGIIRAILARKDSDGWGLSLRLCYPQQE